MSRDPCGRSLILRDTRNAFFGDAVSAARGPSDARNEHPPAGHRSSFPAAGGCPAQPGRGRRDVRHARTGADVSPHHLRALRFDLPMGLSQSLRGTLAAAAFRRLADHHGRSPGAGVRGSSRDRPQAPGDQHRRRYGRRLHHGASHPHGAGHARHVLRQSGQGPGLRSGLAHQLRPDARAGGGRPRRGQPLARAPRCFAAFR